MAAAGGSDGAGGNGHETLGAPPPLASMTLRARPQSAAARGGRAGTLAPSLAQPPRATAAVSGPTAAQQQQNGHQSQRQQQQQHPGPSEQPQRGRAAWATPIGAGLLLARLIRGAASHLMTGLHHDMPVPDGGLSDYRLFPSLLPRHRVGAGGSPPAAAAPSGPALVWFRGDLRVSDHAPLRAACDAAGPRGVVPVFCFDPREFGQAPGPLDRATPYRAAFVLRALGELRAALRARGADLVVRLGRPEDVLPKLAAQVGAARVFCHGEATEGERAVERAVAAALRAQGHELRVLWGGTLLHPEDLPFRLPAVPLAYPEFRDACVGAASGGHAGRRRQGGGRGAVAVAVRDPLPAPEAIPALPSGRLPTPGEVPSLQQLGYPAAAARRAEADSAVLWAGLDDGERAALQAMRGLAPAAGAAADATSSGRGTGCGEGAAESAAAAALCASPALVAKLSPWLAMGCVSPRTLYHTLHREGQQPGAPSPHAAAFGRRGTAHAPGAREDPGSSGAGDAAAPWLLFELLWRDFFRFVNVRLASEVPGKGRADSSNTADTAATLAFA